MVVILSDTRNLHERAAALEAEERYRVAFHTSPDAINLNRLSDGLYVDINDGFTRLTGFTRDDVIGRTSTEVGIWAEPIDRDRLVATLREKGQVDNFQSQFRRKNGSTATGLMAARIIELKGQRHILSITRDIEELKRAQDNLKAGEERFRIITEASPVGIAMSRTCDGTILFCNSLFAQWLELAPEDLVGRRTTDFYQDPDDRRILFEKLREEGKVENLELRVMTASGVPFWILTSAHPMEFRGEQVLLSASTNISRLKATEDALRRAKEQADAANRAKTDFLAHMSHELRTPLNSVIGFSELLEGEVFGPLGSARNREYVADIKRSGSHLLRLINDILDVSQIEVGTLKLHEETIDVGATVDACLGMVRERAFAKAQELSAEVPAEVPRLWADATAVKRILLNLLANSIKFTPPGGRVRVEACCGPDGGLCLSVADTGIGIASQDIPRVIQPFSQVRDIMTSGRNDGVGLGLFLVKSLAEKHSATLSIDSTVGVGTTVRVAFPKERTRVRQDVC